MSRAIIRNRIALALALCLSLIVVVSSGGLAQEAVEDQVAATPHPLGPTIPPELDQFKNDWPAPDGNLNATRDASGSSIDSSNLSELNVAWTFDIEASTGFGGMTATPIILGDTVYVEDMKSNVFALDRATGEVTWQHRYDISTIGPNGLAAGYGMLYGAIGDTAGVFALDAASGDEVWRVRLSNNSGEGIDMAPIVYDNTVYVSTVPGNDNAFYRGGQKGILYALDASTGQTIWQWDTTTGNLWGNARVNSGGGLWYPPSFDDNGNIYFGTGNAAPWPGNKEFPNGSSRPGDNDYASSIVSLDPTSGSVRWNYNAKPHDLFDHDFQNTPVIVKTQVNNQDVTLAIGSGKTGTVAAVNADTGELIWKTAVGKHQNDDLREIPQGQTVEVYPGILGGVETPIAYADGKVFVPVVNLPTNHMSTGYDAQSLDFTAGSGELVALNVADGSVLWKTEMPQSNFGGATVSNNVVFTSGLDGVFRAYSADSGDLLWSYRAQAGFNASPAISGDMVIVAAAGILAPSPDAPANVKQFNQLIAFKIGGAGATPEASASPATVIVQPSPAASAEAGASPVAGEVRVEAKNLAFTPATIEIPAGTAVTWTNDDAVAHTVTERPEAGEPFFNQPLPPDESWSFTFTTPGTYAYYCVPHPFMTGTIVVD